MAQMPASGAKGFTRVVSTADGASAFEDADLNLTEQRIADGASPMFVVMRGTRTATSCCSTTRTVTSGTTPSSSKAVNCWSGRSPGATPAATPSRQRSPTFTCSNHATEQRVSELAGLLRGTGTSGD